MKLLSSLCLSLGLSLMLSGALVNQAFAACTNVSCVNSANCAGKCNGIGSNGTNCTCQGTAPNCFCFG